MKFCTVCGKPYNETGVCECGNVSPAAQANTVLEQQPTPMEQSIQPEQPAPEPIAQPVIGGPVPVQPTPAQPITVASAPAGPDFATQVKGIISRGLKIFSKPAEAIEEGKNETDIKGLAITALLATAIIFVAMLIFKKLLVLFITMGAIGEAESILEIVLGLIMVLSYDVSSVLELDGEMYFKIFICVAITVMVFYAVHATMMFIWSKVAKKEASFMNVLVSSNIGSFSIMGMAVITGLSLMINEGIGLLAMLFGLLHFAGLTAKYLKAKFGIGFNQLVYMVPTTLIVNIGLGMFISSKIIEAILS